MLLLVFVMLQLFPDKKGDLALSKKYGPQNLTNFIQKMMEKGRCMSFQKW